MKELNNDRLCQQKFMDLAEIIVCLNFGLKMIQFALAPTALADHCGVSLQPMSEEFPCQTQGLPGMALEISKTMKVFSTKQNSTSLFSSVSPAADTHEVG